MKTILILSTIHTVRHTVYCNILRPWVGDIIPLCFTFSQSFPFWGIRSHSCRFCTFCLQYGNPQNRLGIAKGKKKGEDRLSAFNHFTLFWYPNISQQGFSQNYVMKPNWCLSKVLIKKPIFGCSIFQLLTKSSCSLKYPNT